MIRPTSISFCIPTYNRCDILRGSLNHLRAYDGDDIQIVICDNASPDDTEELISKITDPRIGYHRNDSNIGAVRNIIKTFQVATAEWVFTLSDEDHVDANIVKNLLQAINAPEYATAAVMLGNIRNATGPYPYYGYHDGSEYVPYKWPNKIYAQGDEAIEAVGFHHKYMSGVMIRRRCIDFEALTEFERGACGVAPHTVAYTRACAEGDAVTLDTDFLVKTDQSTAKSHVESLNDSHYRHPDNRYRTFEYYVDLADSLMTNLDKKMATVARIYGYYLDEGTYGWWHLLNHSDWAERYGVESETTFDLAREVKRFNARAREKFERVFQDSEAFRVLSCLLDQRLAYFKEKRKLA